MTEYLVPTCDADAEDEETRDIVGVIRECHLRRMRKAEKEGLPEEQ